MDDLDDLPVSGVNFKARQRRGRMPERTDQ